MRMKAAALLTLLLSPAAGRPVSGVDQRRHLRYGFTLINTTGRTVENAELWAYAPVKKTSAQECLDLRASLPFDTAVDAWGNQVLHFRVGEVPPYGRRGITVDAVLRMSAEPGREKTPRPLRRKTLLPEPFVESGDPDILRLAAALRRKTVEGTADNIFQWVTQNLAIAAPDPDPRGALSALKKRRGDCTEAMFLYMALGRAAGVPTRGVAGYICPSDAALDPAAHHNWAEFSAGGRWRLADPPNRVYSDKAGDYVAFKIIGGGAAKDDFQRFRVTGEGLEARMNGGGES